MKKDKLRRYLDVAGFISMFIGIVVAFLLYSLRYDELWFWYSDLRDILMNLESQIAQLDKVWEFIAAILLLYLIKCFVPIYFTSTVCFLTGIVLPVYLAIPVNILGLCVQFIGKYFWGKYFNGKRGPALTWRWVKKNDKLWELIKKSDNDKGNRNLLLISRLVPCMPVNMISSIYGYLDYGCGKFLLFSIIGFLPRLISFTFVGRNMFDPLSSGFLVPIMTIFILGGIGCFAASWAWKVYEKGKEKIPEYISTAKIGIEKGKKLIFKTEKSENAIGEIEKKGEQEND